MMITNHTPNQDRDQAKADSYTFLPLLTNLEFGCALLH